MTYTAIITPFHEDFSVDYQSLENLLKLQFESSVDGIVALGSTAETIVLEEEEQRQIMKFIMAYRASINSTKSIYVGVSSSSTKQVMDRILYYEGCDYSDDILGYLIVTPPYNKPQQDALVRHYIECGNLTSKDIIVYNVPSRTGVNIAPSTYLSIINALSNNILIKEASDNSNQIVELFQVAGKSKAIILSGNDDLVPFFNSLGGKGVISVVSNLYPDLTVKACNGDIESYFELLPLIKNCFVQTNPVPIKSMLKEAGVIATSQVRMPLLRMQNS